MTSFAAGVDGVTFESSGARLLGAFYRGAGQEPRPTAVLLHGVPGAGPRASIRSKPCCTSRRSPRGAALPADDPPESWAPHAGS